MSNPIKYIELTFRNDALFETGYIRENGIVESSEAVPNELDDPEAPWNTRLRIDVETGQIINWKPIPQKAMEDILASDREEEEDIPEPWRFKPGRKELPHWKFYLNDQIFLVDNRYSTIGSVMDRFTMPTKPFEPYVNNTKSEWDHHPMPGDEVTIRPRQPQMV